MKQPNNFHYKNKWSVQSHRFDVFKMKSSTANKDFIIWGKTYIELQDTEPLQPVTIMPTEQMANNNAVSAGCDKIGTVCNDCPRQSVNRSIKCYYRLRQSNNARKRQMW